MGLIFHFSFLEENNSAEDYEEGLKESSESDGNKSELTYCIDHDELFEDKDMEPKSKSRTCIHDFYSFLRPTSK